MFQDTVPDLLIVADAPITAKDRGRTGILNQAGQLFHLASMSLKAFFNS